MPGTLLPREAPQTTSLAAQLCPTAPLQSPEQVSTGQHAATVPGLAAPPLRPDRLAQILALPLTNRPGQVGPSLWVPMSASVKWG